MINIKIEGLDQVLKQFDGQNISRGVKIGLGKVGNSVRTLASAKIREEYNLKKSDVDRTFTVRADADHVVVKSQGRPINLTYFNARQYGSRNGKRVTIRRKGDTLQTSVRGKAGAFGGVAVNTVPGETRLLYGSFMARVKAGTKGAFSIGVFKRVPGTTMKSRGKYAGKPHGEQIINKAMISVPSMFTGARVLPAIKEYLGSGRAATTIGHEVEQAIKRATGPSGA